MQTKNTIYIYAGPGTNSGSIQHTRHTLKNILDPKYSLQEIEPADVIKGTWTQDAALFVLPGGADIPYHKALSPRGNHIIHQYVLHGGSFLGICAGAYYSGKAVEFAKNTDLEVSEVRDLGFFPDRIVGPTLKEYVYDSYEGATAASIRTSNGAHVFNVYYNGGGHFVHAEQYPEIEILAYYEDTPDPKQAAIVHITHGKGNVILSGVHWEYTPKFLDPTDPHLKAIIPDLSAHEEDRIALAKSILNTLSLEVR